MPTPDESTRHPLPSSFSPEAYSHPALPARPKPSADTGIIPDPVSPSEDTGTLPLGDDIDIFILTPVAALKMLCGSIETLILITGDIPPTPPASHPSTPNLRTMQAEKDDVARSDMDGSSRRPQTPQPSEDIDGVPPKAKTPIGSPELSASEPFNIVGANMKSLNIQHIAITRKFYSKKPPPIPLEEYLMRLHRYCPMSTAVYLATSLYIHRLAVVERIIPVTARNVHRLLLGGLRVAMKALEDLSYPHRRFAKVGGVTESELGRLEVSFCFLANFELKVDREMLLKQAIAMRSAPSLYELPSGFQPKLPPLREKRNPSLGQMMPGRFNEAVAG